MTKVDVTRKHAVEPTMEPQTPLQSEPVILNATCHDERSGVVPLHCFLNHRRIDRSNSDDFRRPETGGGTRDEKGQDLRRQNGYNPKSNRVDLSKFAWPCHFASTLPDRSVTHRCSLIAAVPLASILSIYICAGRIGNRQIFFRCQIATPRTNVYQTRTAGQYFSDQIWRKEIWWSKTLRPISGLTEWLHTLQQFIAFIRQGTIDSAPYALVRCCLRVESSHRSRVPKRRSWTKFQRVSQCGICWRLLCSPMTVLDEPKCRNGLPCLIAANGCTFSGSYMRKMMVGKYPNTR